MTGNERTRVTMTLAMATHSDFYGAEATLKNIYIDHAAVLPFAEVLVLDNTPRDSKHATALEHYIKHLPNCRYVPYLERTGTAIRDELFRLAKKDFVLVMDSHLHFDPGVLLRLQHYLEANRDTLNLLQGPLVADNLQVMGTHFDPVWGGCMFGKWGFDKRGAEVDNEPFEIPNQGLGLFGCFKKAWLGFNPLFRGFGGEEGYIHEKYRQAGRKTLCLPFLRWHHRWGNPNGAKYPNRLEDRLRNYVLGWTELGKPLDDVIEHFHQSLKPDIVTRVVSETLAEWKAHTSAQPAAAPPDMNKMMEDAKTMARALSLLPPQALQRSLEKLKQDASEVFYALVLYQHNKGGFE